MARFITYAEWLVFRFEAVETVVLTEDEIFFLDKKVLESNFNLVGKGMVFILKLVISLSTPTKSCTRSRTCPGSSSRSLPLMMIDDD